MTSLDDTLAAFVEGTPGGVEVLVKRNGVSEHAVAGTGSVDGEELTPGRPFRVGSISKPLIAVMVLQLVDEGRADLDATLDSYLSATVIGEGSTIRQLLSHRSGIPSYTEQPQFLGDVLADPTREFTPVEILSYVEETPGAQAGRYAYSNTNYILLGQLIEHLDGTDINNALRRRITGPAGLEETVFETAEQGQPESLVGGWSLGFLQGQPAAEYTSVATSAWAAGSLISTTDDLTLFLEALASGQLISAESLVEMSDFGSDGYGLGLADVAFSPTEPGYGHSGSIPGYNSTMAIEPSTGDLLVVLTSNDSLIADQLAPRVLSIG